MIVTEENRRGGYGGEISAMIAEEMFDLLDCPIVRIVRWIRRFPSPPFWSRFTCPMAQDIANAIRAQE